jgi:hypothetical protein
MSMSEQDFVTSALPLLAKLLKRIEALEVALWKQGLIHRPNDAPADWDRSMLRPEAAQEVIEACKGLAKLASQVAALLRENSSHQPKLWETFQAGFLKDLSLFLGNFGLGLSEGKVLCRFKGPELRPISRSAFSILRWDTRHFEGRLAELVPQGMRLTGTELSNGGRRRRKSIQDYDRMARKYLERNPTCTRKQLAGALGCSERTVNNLPSWKTVRAELAKGRKPKSPPTMSLTAKVEANLGDHDEELQRLIEDHEADNEPSPLDDHRSDGPRGKVRYRKRL